MTIESTRVRRLREAGVSIWLDTLSRDLIESGDLAELAAAGVTGATSNPTIFARALAGTDLYDRPAAQLTAAGVTDPREAFLRLALEDVRAAARIFRPAHDESAGADGFVSLEVTPDVAYDAEGTTRQATELWSRLDAPNVMIKVPATAAGPAAIEELTARGVNVNVTLLFSLSRYEAAMEAYLRGLERRLAAGEPVDGIASVASFFVSRVDAKVDPALPPDSSLRGRVAIANAAAAYDRARQVFAGARWERVAGAGARAQRPLWASTGTKDPAYSDVLYVESLVGPGVVNTMPLDTLRAFADHGEARPTLEGAAPEAKRVLAAAARAGIDLDAVGRELEDEGVRAFADSYDSLLEDVQTKLQTAAHAA
jgi:transaldolase